MHHSLSPGLLATPALPGSAAGRSGSRCSEQALDRARTAPPGTKEIRSAGAQVASSNCFLLNKQVHAQLKDGRSGSVVFHSYEVQMTVETGA